MIGGEAVGDRGARKDKEKYDKGGMINLQGGSSKRSTGGDVAITSGRSEATTRDGKSGDVKVMTGDASKTRGLSGDIEVKTGEASDGKSGNIWVHTGDSDSNGGGERLIILSSNLVFLIHVLT